MRRLITFDTGAESYHLRISDSYPNILTAGARGRVSDVAEHLNDSEIIENEYRGKAVVNGFYKEMPVTAFCTGEGTGSVSCTWPEVIEACNDKDANVIRIGTSGGLQEYLNVGDFVVTTGVIGEDNASYKVIELLNRMRYAFKNNTEFPPDSTIMKLMEKIEDLYGSPEEFCQKMDSVIGPPGMLQDIGYVPFTDEKVRKAISDAARENALNFQKVYEGPTAVTPEIYCNTVLAEVSDPGKVLAVSMEMSAICAYRDFYNLVYGMNIRAGNLLMISDKVIGKSGDMSEFLKNKKQIEKMHIITGLEALYKLRVE